VSLVTPAEVRALVQTDKTDEQLQAIIDREEAEVVRLYGPHYVDEATTVTETIEGGTWSLCLRRRLSSVSSVTEKVLIGDDGTTLTENEDYFVWSGQGRLERLPQGASWGALVEVEYVPADDIDNRKAVIIELVRLALERTAMQQEDVAGEYSYKAPEWETERARLLRRLGFVRV